MLVPRFVKIAPLGLLLIVIALVVAGLAFRFIADNANPPHAPLYDAQIKKELSSYLDTLVATDQFSGVVLLAKNGEPLFVQAYAMANKSRNVANDVGTKFNLGSLNKMFTAIAIAQLAQEGKLQFGDSVAKHLPDYPNKDVASRVTIHQLLTHTSGMGDYLDSKRFAELRGTLESVNAHFPLFVNDPLSFEPGSRFQYSNAGYVVLGAIIERVSGKSYFDYVREHIFKPAGMVNTDSYELEQNVPNLAIGYTKLEGRESRQDNARFLPAKGSPAGGGYSTVEDLHQFARALSGYKLLNEQYTKIVLSGKVDAPFGPNIKYAYGFGDQRVNGHRIIGHSGGYPGVSAMFQMYVDQGFTAIVLGNYDEAAQMVAKRLREIIAGG
jgi:CubicO group peptidase (beta-lactamase class C family)